MGKKGKPKSRKTPKSKRKKEDEFRDTTERSEDVEKASLHDGKETHKSLGQFSFENKEEIERPNRTYEDTVSIDIVNNDFENELKEYSESQQITNRKSKNQQQGGDFETDNQRNDYASLYYEENERVSPQQNGKLRNKKSKRSAPITPNDLQDSAQEKKKQMSLGEFANKNMDNINRKNNYNQTELHEAHEIQSKERAYDENDNLDEEASDIKRGKEDSNDYYSERKKSDNTVQQSLKSEMTILQKMKNKIGISVKPKLIDDKKEEVPNNMYENSVLNDQDERSNITPSDSWDKPQINRMDKFGKNDNKEQGDNKKQSNMVQDEQDSNNQDSKKEQSSSKEKEKELNRRLKSKVQDRYMDKESERKWKEILKQFREETYCFGTIANFMEER